MLFKQKTSSHKASVINHNNTTGKQPRCKIHSFEYNKYPISTFLLEPSAKKVYSVSFVSQYIYVKFVELCLNQQKGIIEDFFNVEYTNMLT